MLTPLLMLGMGICMFPHLVICNFLHAGCTVQRSISSSTFEDSLVFHMFLPSIHPYLVVDVRQQGNTVSLTTNGTMQNHFHHQWEKLSLVMRGTLQLVFENGTVWLETNTITEEPLKNVKVRGGSFLKDCPQGMPNWCLRRGAIDLRRVLRRGRQETFSLLPTTPACLSITVGQMMMVVCWDSHAKTYRLLLSDTCDNGLHPVPAFQWIRLQIAYNEWDSAVEIQNPEDKVQLIKFYARDNNQDIIFHTEGLTNNLYVIHHLQKILLSTSATLSHTANISLWVAAPLVGVLLLLLLLTLYLAIVFRQRWTRCSEALMVLRKGPPALPSPCYENDVYLVPGQVKERSSHIYESIKEVRSSNTAFTKPCSESVN